MTIGKVPWMPDPEMIKFEVRAKRTYYRKCRRVFRIKSSTASYKNIEDYLIRTRSLNLFKKALHGDILSGQALSHFVTARVAKQLKLDVTEEEYFQRAIRAIADGEQPNIAFLTARKNGKRDESHISYRDQWIFHEISDQFDSGKDFNEAANAIHDIMAEFHYRAQFELAEAEESGVVQRVEEAKRLLIINKPLTPERIGDIFEEQYIKLRRLNIDFYLESRALRKKSKKE